MYNVNLEEMINETESQLLSIIEREMNTLDDREERDHDLESVTYSVQMISEIIAGKPKYTEQALGLVKTLKSCSMNEEAKDLEIGIAYAMKSAA